MNVCTLWWIFCVFISSSFIEDLKAVLHFAACCEGFPLSLKASCSYHQCLSCMFEPFHGFFGHNLPYSWFASLLFWEFDLLMQPKYGLLDTETASKCKCFSLGKGKNSLSCWKNKTNKQWINSAHLSVEQLLTQSPIAYKPLKICICVQKWIEFHKALFIIFVDVTESNSFSSWIFHFKSIVVTYRRKMIIGLEKTENIVLHKVNWAKDGNMIGHRMKSGEITLHKKTRQKTNIEWPWSSNPQAALYLKQTPFCSENHCTGSGMLLKAVVSEHSVLLYPQM